MTGCKLWQRRSLPGMGAVHALQEPA